MREERSQRDFRGRGRRKERVASLLQKRFYRREDKGLNIVILVVDEGIEVRLCRCWFRPCFGPDGKREDYS